MRCALNWHSASSQHVPIPLQGPQASAQMRKAGLVARSALRLCASGPESGLLSKLLPGTAAAAAGSQHWPSSSSLGRHFSSAPASEPEADQAQRQQRRWQDRQPGKQQRFGQRRERPERGSPAGAQHAQPSGGSGDSRGAVFIPPKWKQQAWRDRDAPIVREMLEHLDKGELLEAREAFFSVFNGLRGALQQGETPAASEVPPPFAWKLYFSTLAATRRHSHFMFDVLDTMHRLGVQPQPACYVIALKQMAHQGLGHPAYTTIHRMKELGMAPTIRCYQFAIEASMRSEQFSFAAKLFDEVLEQGLAKHPYQKAQLGKQLMYSCREFARHARFENASAALDHLETLGLRVPSFLLSDLLQPAVSMGHVEAMRDFLRRLAHATHTFQEVPGEGEAVTRPVKIEEGLLLAVLEAAANKGEVPLAEATWQLLERSLALPNTPSPLSSRQQPQSKPQEEKSPDASQQAAAAAADTAGAAGEGEAAVDAAALAEVEEAAEEAEGEGRRHEGRAKPVSEAEAAAALAQVGADLEAADSAAAEQAERARAGDAGRKGSRGPPVASKHWARLAEEEARAMAERPRGVRSPSLLSHLALIHAYARGRELEHMFAAVERLQQAYPEEQEALSYHAGLPFCVDSLAESGRNCDEAFELLQGWADQGRAVTPAQLNLVVAALCQIGDLTHAFATFDAYQDLGVPPDADTYNALMQGCIESGRVDTALKVREQMAADGAAPNAHTHRLLVDAQVVAGNVPAMMEALNALEAAGHIPTLALMERCMARAEREGDREAVAELMTRLRDKGYRIIGVHAKARRWQAEGGMQMLTGSSRWFSREDVQLPAQEPQPRHRGGGSASTRQQREDDFGEEYGLEQREAAAASSQRIGQSA